MQARTHVNDQPNVTGFDHLLLLPMFETVCQRRSEKIVLCLHVYELLSADLQGLAQGGNEVRGDLWRQDDTDL